MKQTIQEKTWTGKFGKEYTDRNMMSIEEQDILYKTLYNISNEELTHDFLDGLNINNILEVGCNIGNQLLFLKKHGYSDLWGIELQEYAVEIAKKRTENINIIQSSVLDIPYKDNYFDLVFTSGLLIHISPDDIDKAMKEIYRCTNRYIWGLESYDKDRYTQIEYRNQSNICWKTDFAKLFLNKFHGLELLKTKLIHYNDNDNIDIMYLLEKST